MRTPMLVRHTHVYWFSGSIRLDALVLNKLPLPEHECIHTLVVDDHVGIARDLRGSKRNARQWERDFVAARGTYERVDLPVVEHKGRRSELRTEVVGTAVWGDLGLLAASPKRRMILAHMARDVARVGGPSLPGCSAGWWATLCLYCFSGGRA